jgi:hypothetical protein
LDIVGGFLNYGCEIVHVGRRHEMIDLWSGGLDDLKESLDDGGGGTLLEFES